MATKNLYLYLGGSLSRSSGSYNESGNSPGSISSISATASCSVSYNSSTKAYSVQSVNLKLRGVNTHAATSYVSGTITSAYANNDSGNWSSFNFKPSRNSGSITLYTASDTNISYGTGSWVAANTEIGSYTNVVAKCAFLFSLKTTEGIDYYNVYITLNFRLEGAKLPRYTVTYYQNKDFGGGLISSNDYTSGTTVTVKSAYNRSLSPINHSIGVSFNTQGGVPQPDYRDKSVTQSRKYVFESWSGSQPGTTFTVNGNKTFTEEYNIDYGNIVYKTLGSLPSVNKKGYKRSNIWVYSNGGQANGTDEITSSQTLYAQYEPQNYKIKFDLNGGKQPSDTGNLNSYTIDKTYGIHSQRSPNWVPTKVGYLFTGWSNQTGTVAFQGRNEVIDDRVYNATYNEYSTGNVTLYAQYRLNPNGNKYNYYIINSAGNPVSCQDSDEYNITQSEYVKYAPNRVSEMSGDYVFLGWCDEKPYEWDHGEINQGKYGIYSLPTIAPESEIPIKIDITKLTKLEDWGRSGSLSEQYYGIWAKTGKYVKIGDAFKKVSVAYVKIDGKWKPISDSYVKIDNNWKHEI